MKYYLITILSLSIFFISCGKKEDVQTSSQQQTQQTNTNNQTQQQSTQQTQANNTDPKDVKKTDDKNNNTKLDPKTPSKPVNMDPITGEVKNVGRDDIDFAPIYAKKCAKCHGRDGHGKSDGAPSLTVDSTRSKSDSKLFQILSKGVKNPDPDGDDMPSWKGKLTDDEINAGVKYIRSIP